ncbi:hypothetical protein SUGI_0277990 [Cryptomeria japonica]|nr:hypothetical protein SUGI_0277990 [Cryptomeria japonica]
MGDGSEVEYFPHLFSHKKSFEWMNYLDKHIPWTRPSLHIFGRICSQPRETCYVAKDGLPAYKYSGYEPEIHSWDDYPPLKDILKSVHDALPGTTFNSLLLNRYKHGSDYVGWHSDNEPLYGPTPTIASVTLGAEREFLMRRKKTQISRGEGTNALNNSVHSTENKNTNASELKLQKATTNLISAGSEPSSSSKRDYDSSFSVSTNIFDILKTRQRDVQSKHSKDRYSFTLNHGSLFVMRGYTQRDWEHSVPKRMKMQGLRINLTFRYVIES